jgi:rRNA biogenesis protein RRP5
LFCRGDESEYFDGRYVKCCVLGNVKNKNQMLELSLRDSRANGEMEDDSVPSEGETVHGFVVSTNKAGCFVRLSRSVEGRVILKELSDEFIPRPDEMYPPGRLVVGKVKSVKELERNKKNNLAAMIDLDMRESVLLTSGKRVTLDDIEINSKYTGVVTRVESYGAFVRIDNSDISGLAHVSECSDAFVKNLFDLYNPGDMVKLL